jgi:hypothetical protein
MDMDMTSIRHAMQLHEIDILEEKMAICISDLETHRMNTSKLHEIFQDIIRSNYVDHQRRMASITIEIKTALSDENIIWNQYQHLQSTRDKLLNSIGGYN